MRPIAGLASHTEAISPIWTVLLVLILASLNAWGRGQYRPDGGQNVSSYTLVPLRSFLGLKSHAEPQCEIPIISLIWLS